MNQYVTGAALKALREKKGLTQEALAARIHVTGKAVSKWETGKGLPDITLLEPLAGALGVSVIELMNGGRIQNRNRQANMLKLCFYVCPVCGNVIQAAGEALICCCGITLPPLQAEEPDEEHRLQIGKAEDEYYVTSAHPMTKEHSLSFIAAVSDQGVQFVRLYPEGNAEARFKISRVRKIYAYCNHHGLFRMNVPCR